MINSFILINYYETNYKKKPAGNIVLEKWRVKVEI
jgi:hypothetical protein